MELEASSLTLIKIDTRLENDDGKIIVAVKGSILLNAERTPDFTTTCASCWNLTAEFVGSQEVSNS